jgi:HEPN domain-containing protein
MAYDRSTLQQLAEARLVEAKLLRANGQPSGAYYLAGYAVELALKALIAATFKEGEIPERRRVNDIYTHDLPSLLGLAGLKDQLDAAMDANPDLRRRWTVIENWSEQARYNVWTPEAADAILDAVGADKEGLMQWLKSRW